jgi:hypothetical protein
MCKDLVNLIQLLAVISATSVTAECIFSCLRHVEAWLQSVISWTKLKSAIMFHSNRDVQPDIETVVQEFFNMNDI